ncbi:hypothetical protein NW754_013433 [Fusarium falciforme]|nr:hypothetical protein NW754_013433 [Fusarium falciforme]
MSTEKKFDNLHTEMFDLGLQNRREVVGDAYVNAALENGKSEFAYPGQQLVTEAGSELGVHVRGALNNGLTEIEVREAILHATIYCGVPASVEAFKVAQKTINDMVEKGEHNRELAELSPFLEKAA